LDFLGFSRVNRYLSMSYTRFSLENFRVAFGRFEAPDLAPALDAMRKAMIAHGAILVYFVFFRNSFLQ
jgi:hypothetical protein